MNYRDAFSQLLFAFKYLLNLRDKDSLCLKTIMTKTGQIRRCQGLKKLGRRSGFAKTPIIFFFIIDCALKSNSFVLEGNFEKKHLYNSFLNYLLGIH